MKNSRGRTRLENISTHFPNTVTLSIYRLKLILSIFYLSKPSVLDRKSCQLTKLSLFPKLSHHDSKGVKNNQSEYQLLFWSKDSVLIYIFLESSAWGPSSLFFILCVKITWDRRKFPFWKAQKVGKQFQTSCESNWKQGLHYYY